MSQGRLGRLLLWFLPGFAMALAVAAWGYFYLAPPAYQVPQWDGQWSEPKQAEGKFKSWRVEGDVVVGETEPWPHKHPRANSFLLSENAFHGDVEVQLAVEFERGRYLGCYLCYDPKTDSGYWLSTGHAVGNYPNQAYIKIVRNGDWQTMAHGSLEIRPGQKYQLSFRRTGQELAVLVGGEPVVTWSDDTFHKGHVQLRLHNTKVKVHKLSVTELPNFPQ